MLRVIAIDGPAASGKSTTAKAVAARLGWAHLDSGAVYRAVALAALDNLDETQWTAARVRVIASTLPVCLVRAGSGFRVEVAGVDVARAIRSAQVTAAASRIATLPEVREWVTEEVRREALESSAIGVVIEGRDIGTVVFPEAPLKVFLTASPAARADRRLAQTGQVVDAAQVEREAARLAERDTRDAQRAVAPLKAASDAVTVDTTDLTFEAQVEHVVSLAHRVFSG